MIPGGDDVSVGDEIIAICAKYLLTSDALGEKNVADETMFGIGACLIGIELDFRQNVIDRVDPIGDEVVVGFFVERRGAGSPGSPEKAGVVLPSPFEADGLARFAALTGAWVRDLRRFVGAHGLHPVPVDLRNDL